MEWRAFWCLRRERRRAKDHLSAPGRPLAQSKARREGGKENYFLCRFSRGCCGGGESSGSAKKGPRTILLLCGKGRNQVLSVSLVCASPPPPNWDLRTTQPSLSPLPPRPIIAPLPPSPPTPPTPTSNPTWLAQAPGSTPIKRAELGREGKVGRRRRKTFFSS